ncbi:MAG: MBOAT family protein [Candidatus Binatia bacterium]
MTLNGFELFVIAGGFLIGAGVLAKGSRWRRKCALLSATAAILIPWFAPADVPLLRGGLAIWTTWCCGRVVDLTSDSQERSIGYRLWHVFALIDTRHTRWASPAIDWRALGKTVVYGGVAALGFVIATEGAARTAGSWYWGLRWTGGALFFYCLADAVEGAVRALYRASGVVVSQQHVVPIASRSVQEFWGKRWNRAVGAWLRAQCFLPFARSGRVRTGFLAAFAASAVFHAYFTWVAVGHVMALAMLSFFLIQGVIALLEFRLGVARWQPLWARVWTIVAVLGCSPLFIEPFLRIVH